MPQSHMVFCSVPNFNPSQLLCGAKGVQKIWQLTRELIHSTDLIVTWVAVTELVPALPGIRMAVHVFPVD